MAVHRRPTSAKDSTRWMRARAVCTGGLLLLALFAVLARAAKVQLFDRSRLARLQRDQTRRELEWAPRRGLISDRRGEPLAVTRDADSIFVDPSAFPTQRERDAAADALARALRTDRRRISEKLVAEGRRFVWIKRRVDEATADRVRAVALDGIELVKEPRRVYPQRELAGHVLGFVGDDGAGQEGLERELDGLLRGKPVQVQAIRDAHGNTVLEHGAPDASDLTGATVTLTLDSGIQLAAEKELQQAVTVSHASGGWAVVLDVQSGAVLALAGTPSFDANKPGRDPQLWRNRAIQDQLEPGSTIKSFVVARALDEGVLGRDELLYCEHGVWAHAGGKIHDTHPVDWATPAMVLRDSSNICAAKIGEKLGKDRLIAGLRAFGFGEKTALGLPGEARGLVKDARGLSLIGLDNISFGQGLSATGVQTVVAMAAIANGGVLLKPYLVARAVAPDGTVLLERGREEVRRVLRPETARTLTAMLEEVVAKGTGARAALAEYRAAGKTGTAQKVDPIRGGYGEKRLSSFLGFVPADAPKVAILVVIDEPEGKGAEVTGATVAAPAWGRIARESLRQLGVLPSSAVEIASASAPEPAPEALPAPLVAKTPAPAGSAVVPDVAGLGARLAVRRLAESALEPDLRGSGRAVWQSPPPGAIVKRGARVKVTLAPSGDRG